MRADPDRSIGPGEEPAILNPTFPLGATPRRCSPRKQPCGPNGRGVHADGGGSSTRPRRRGPPYLSEHRKRSRPPDNRVCAVDAGVPARFALPAILAARVDYHDHNAGQPSHSPFLSAARLGLLPRIVSRAHMTARSHSTSPTSSGMRSNATSAAESGWRPTRGTRKGGSRAAYAGGFRSSGATSRMCWAKDQWCPSTSAAP